MRNRIFIFLAKFIQKVAKIKGGGSALPGVFMEKLNPKFLKDCLDDLPHGVVVVSGTNGKTTTTKMIVEMLQSQGFQVFTNKTGSNFVRGVISALISEVDMNGKLPATIAVLELDEAHAVHFIEKVKPKYSLLLNVMRDQLDRFGEIDYTAKLLQKIGEKTTGKVILNGGDLRLSKPDFSNDFSAEVKTFGVSSKMADFFPSDEEIYDSIVRKDNKFDFTLEDFSKSTATVSFGGEKIEVALKISGIHNILNMTAAIAVVKEVLDSENLKFKKDKLISALGKIQPAFGRGEILEVYGSQVEILLVKNPAGFRSNLESVNCENSSIMIAINDNYADGRDMSWLWDVDFSKLQKRGVAKISGIRAYDMALRLIHDEVQINERDIEIDISKALHDFLERGESSKKIFCTYTAMLKIREELSKITDMEKIL